MRGRAGKFFLLAKPTLLLLFAVGTLNGSHQATAQSAASSSGDQTIMSAQVRQKCLLLLREGLKSEEFWPAMHAAEALTIAGEAAEVREALAPRLPKETDDQHCCGLARELVRAGERFKAQ